MNLAELFESVLSDSSYAGEFSFKDLMEITGKEGYNAIATQEKKDREEKDSTNILVFVDGEGEGAIQVDEYGMIYGDKVLYNLDRKGEFRLFIITRNLAESISARCRIYEKSHLMGTEKTENLPEIAKFSLKPAKCTIQVCQDGKPAEGLRVKVLRVGESGVADTTSRSGTVSFILQKGKYDCIITGKDKKDYKYKIVLPGREAFINLDI